MKSLLAFVFLTLACAPVLAQWTIGSRAFGHGSTSTSMVQDTGVTPCTANALNAASATCSLGTVPAGDTIICSTETGDAGNAIGMSDNVNGTYNVGLYGQTNNGGFHNILMIFYFANTAAGSTTVTQTWSPSSGSVGGLSCAAYKNGRSTAVLDSTVFGWNDDGTATTSPALASSFTQASGGGMIYCALSTGTPSNTATAGTNFTIVGQNTTNSIAPQIWTQSTPASTNCPYTIANSDSFTDSILAFLPSSASAGVTPYQGSILEFAALTSGSAPTTLGLSLSVSGGANPGFFSSELVAASVWTVNNTHSDLTASSSGPTAALSSTLTLPVLYTDVASTYNAFVTFDGTNVVVNGTPIAALNLQLVTGNIGDDIIWNILPTATSLSFGYYLEWTIPNTDSNSHSYNLGGINTGSTSGLDLVLAPTGTSMNVDMLGGPSNTTAVLGTGTASTTYWVTAKWAMGGTLSMSFYSGCPSSCTLVGSNTVSDSGNTNPAISYKIGSLSGSQASGDDVWWRNFKVCAGATYPCLP